MFYDFDDKESYLEWVEDWKERYNELSNELRKAKTKGWQSDWKLAAEIRGMKDSATNLLLIRRENKVKSYQMMKERLAKEATV
jgi:hypothetical protein